MSVLAANLESVGNLGQFGWCLVIVVFHLSVFLKVSNMFSNYMLRLENCNESQNMFKALEEIRQTQTQTQIYTKYLH